MHLCMLAPDFLHVDLNLDSQWKDQNLTAWLIS